MKTLLVCFFSCLSGMGFGQLQKQSLTQGIYKSWHDYENNKIVPAQKIHLDHFFSGHSLYITQKGRKIKFNKDSVFGYRDKKGMAFRFYKSYNKEYQILENLKIVIYVQYNPSHTSKGIALPILPNYYFSKTLNSTTLSLTVLNLKKAFPDNYKFHDALDVNFSNGTQVAYFDKSNKKFEVNYLLMKYLNK